MEGLYKAGFPKMGTGVSVTKSPKRLTTDFSCLLNDSNNVKTHLYLCISQGGSIYQE